jgi:tetratricopeptide (TPR) repeat protein
LDPRGLLAVHPLDQRLLEEAEGFLELGIHPLAISSLRKVSAQGRDTFEWNTLMGEYHRSRQDHESAILYFERSLVLRPTELTTHLALGWCYKRTKQLPRAIATLLDAVRTLRTPLQMELGDVTPERLVEAHKSGEIDQVEMHALLMYNLSCYYSLANERDAALYWLAMALPLRPSLVRLIPSESDFDNVRDDPDFLEFVSRRQSDMSEDEPDPQDEETGDVSE